MPFTRPRHWLRWLIGAVVVVAALAAAGPYIHFFNGSTPAALSLSRPLAPLRAVRRPAGVRNLDLRVRLYGRLPGQ
jgi:hypothetical protein